MDFEKDLKEAFRDEAFELLKEIDMALIQLADDHNNSELIHTIFRALHTLKGSGGMFGFTEITDFAHAFETVFDRVRKGTAIIDENILNLSLKAADAIKNLLLNEDTAEAKTARDKILQNLEVITGAPIQKPVQKNSSFNKIPQANQDTTLYKILFTPNEDIFKRGINLLPVLKELSALGKCRIKLNTAKIPEFDKLEYEKCYISFFILIATGEAESRLKDAFVFVAGDAFLSIEKINDHIFDIEPGYKRIGEILVENIDNAVIEQTTIKDKKKEHQKKLESATIRVKHEKLDKLVNLVGEFVTMQSRLFGEAKKRQQTEILSLVEGMGRLTDDLRDIVMKTRMVPVNDTFNEYYRLVFELSRTLKKEIRLQISGGETEIDKNVIDALKDPLMHLIRNASDHGIESPEKRAALGKPEYGTITLYAEHIGGQIIIKVIDDGAGLNYELIRKKATALGLIRESETSERIIFNAIFEPGFTTADTATDISGRGVGMDVVKKNVEKLRGSISLESDEGAGTTVTLSIPLTLAIIDGLLTRIRNHFYILNLSNVNECVDLTQNIMASLGANNLLNLRGDTVPFIRLSDEFDIGENTAEIECMVIAESEGKKIGLIVDQVIGKCQSVIKPLSAAVKKTPGITGASILGDGSVALILDVREIIKEKEFFIKKDITDQESSYEKQASPVNEAFTNIEGERL